MDDQVIEEAFAQAELKVNRANRHRIEAEALFKGYAEADFCRLLEERDSQTGIQEFRVVARPLPADLILAIGDTFHNLNASLDYIMTGMMRAVGASSSRVHFPIDESRGALRKSFMLPKNGKGSPRNRRIVERFPGLAMLLLNTIKPYQGGATRFGRLGGPTTSTSTI